MPLAHCAEQTESDFPSVPYICDEDLLLRVHLCCLTQQARNLFRNLTLSMLRRGYDYVHVSDQYAASMAKCSPEELPSVRNELIRHGLLHVRPTGRFPRYKPVQQAVLNH